MQRKTITAGIDAGKNSMTAGGAEAVLEVCRCGSDFGDVTALFPEMRMGVKFKNPLPRNNFCKPKHSGNRRR